MHQTISINWKLFSEQMPEPYKPILVQKLGFPKPATFDFVNAHVTSRDKLLIPVNSTKNAGTYVWAYQEDVLNVMMLGKDASDGSSKETYLLNLCQVLVEALKSTEGCYGKLTTDEKNIFKNLDILK